MTGYEKCIIRRFHYSANIAERTYTIQMVQATAHLGCVVHPTYCS